MLQTNHTHTHTVNNVWVCFCDRCSLLSLNQHSNAPPPNAPSHPDPSEHEHILSRGHTRARWEQRFWPCTSQKHRSRLLTPREQAGVDGETSFKWIFFTQTKPEIPSYTAERLLLFKSLSVELIKGIRRRGRTGRLLEIRDVLPAIAAV